VFREDKCLRPVLPKYLLLLLAGDHKVFPGSRITFVGLQAYRCLEVRCSALNNSRHLSFMLKRNFSETRSVSVFRLKGFLF
jgi:hypothetical protein